MKKPEFNKPVPLKEFNTRVLVKETRIYDGDNITEITKTDQSNILVFDVKYRRDDTDEYFLVEYRVEVNQNKEYETQLAEYNKAKEKYEADYVLYKAFLDQVAQEKTLKDKEARRRMFEELRKEFE